MVRRTRFAAALLAMFALLFAQVAVSAFACPLDTPPAATLSMDGDHCERMATPNLCDRHCDYGAANVSHASPDLAPDVLALPLPWRALPVATPRSFTRVVLDAPSRNHSPPPLALFGALRI